MRNIDESVANREFTLTDKDFRNIVQLVKARVGIVLADHKKPMVYSRLAKRLRTLGYKSFGEYITFLESKQGEDETVNFVNAITTNLTSFFRESHHFDHLGKWLAERTSKPSGDKRIRIWSAGCSSGPEPYSIAMTIMEHVKAPKSWDIKILATDIDTNMLDVGASGIYPQNMFENLSKARLNKFCSEVEGPKGASYQMHPMLRELIHFKKLNLLENWPMKGQFDIIFCRNVVIYFDKDTQRVLFNRYADLMRDRGMLYIGHSENLHGVSDRFRSEGKTVYQRVK